MENTKVKYTVEEAMSLLLRLGFTKEEVQRRIVPERLKGLLSDDQMEPLYWAAYIVKLEEIPQFLSHKELKEDTVKILQWRLEVGK